MFPGPTEPRFSCWPPKRNGAIRGPEGNQPIFSAGTVRGVLTGHVFTDRPNHTNRKSVLSLQKAKCDLPHKAYTTPFNKLPESGKSNGTHHQVHTNQTNLPEIPQECLNRSLVEFCGVQGLFFFIKKKKRSIFFHNQVYTPLWNSLL